MTELKSIDVLDWGMTSHSEAENLQIKAWQKAYQFGEESILFGELESVITAGPRSESSDYENSSIPHVKVERGGAATLHSPGQLVIYPILHLKNRKLSPKEYVKALLEVTALTYEQLGIEAFPLDSSIGVWTKKGKIAFSGVRIKEGITQYGLSLNVCNDLGLFDQIKACGHEKIELDSVANYDSHVSPFQVFQIWVSCFFRHNAFRKKRLEFDSLDLG